MEQYPGVKLLEFFRRAGNISTDSRNIPSGCLFFALKGPSFDGNRFATGALEAGASLAVIDDPELARQHQDDPRYFFCSDVLHALQDLARLYREELSIPVIAIGGSNGKTTTKELLREVLGTRFRVHATRGNLNNHIGVPLTLLSMPEDTEIAVIELGTNQPGDIAELVEIAEPDFGLITNIGKEHLAGFGSMEGVAREESVLFQYLKKHGGLAFVNQDDPWLEAMSAKLDRVVSYGMDEHANIRARLLGSHPGVSLELDTGIEVHSRLPGAFNFSNILACIAVARHFDIPDWMSITAIASYRSSNNRSQVLETEAYTFLMDCYNANPSSMELALRSFAAQEGEKFFILGDMLELGDYEVAEHEAIYRLVGELGLNKGVFIGPAFCKIAGGESLCFRKAEEAASYLREHPIPENSLVFLKGSRGISVEKAIAHLLESPGGKPA